MLRGSVSIRTSARQYAVDDDNVLVVVAFQPHAPVSDAQPKFPCSAAQKFQVAAFRLGKPRKCCKDSVS